MVHHSCVHIEIYSLKLAWSGQSSWFVCEIITTLPVYYKFTCIYVCEREFIAQHCRSKTLSVFCLTVDNVLHTSHLPKWRQKKKPHLWNINLPSLLLFLRIVHCISSSEFFSFHICTKTEDPSHGSQPHICMYTYPLILYFLCIYGCTFTLVGYLCKHMSVFTISLHVVMGYHGCMYFGVCWNPKLVAFMISNLMAIDSGACIHTFNLQECGDQKVRLSGALTAAGLKATAMVKKLGLGFRGEHHGVVTLLECRSLLQPPMASSTVGE